MKTCLLILLGAMLALPSQARLGDPMKDLKRRYGQPVDSAGTKDVQKDRFTYAWDRYYIVVTVVQGISVSEEFTHTDGREFTLQEIQDVLLISSDPGLSWIQVDGSTWRQRDRTAVWSARTLLVQEKALGRER